MSKTRELTFKERAEIVWRGYLAYADAWLDPRNWFDPGQRKRVGIYKVARAFGYTDANAQKLVKQSNLETGFQSLGFYNSRTNNLFGMHFPRVRKAVNAGSMWNEAEGGNMSVYSNSVQSIVDRIYWDRYNGITGKESNYLDLVQAKGYNPSEDYKELVRSTDSTVSPLLPWWWWIVALVIIVLGSLFYLRR